MERCGWNDSTSDFAPYAMDQIHPVLERLSSGRAIMIARKLGLVERTEWHRRIVTLSLPSTRPICVRQTLDYRVKIDFTIQINGEFHHG
jgi:hypothetical protein